MGKDKKIKIALLVDSKFSPKCIGELYEWSGHQDKLSISHLLVAAHDRGRAEPSGGATEWLKHLRSHGPVQTIELAFFRIIERIESRFMSRASGVLERIDRVDISANVPECALVKVTPSSPCVRKFNDESIEYLKSLNLDLIVTFGAGVRSEDISRVASIGVLTLYYTDSREGYDSAVGFWEVYFKQSRTGFSIEGVSARKEAPFLFRGHLTTRGYYLLNRADLLLASNHYLKRVLERIAEDEAFPAAPASVPYSGSVCGPPRFSQLCVYSFRQVLRKLGGKLNAITRRHPRWSVAFVRSDWTTATLSHGVRIPNPPNDFLADPFVITRDGKDYCFAEDLDYSRNRGSISVYELQSQTAERLGTAVEEPFHLSFPFLFEYDNNLYMCPETCEAKQIRVYKCLEFPLKWEIEKIIVDNINAADTMLFEKDGLWWMITNLAPMGLSDYIEMSIFYSKSPLSENWTPHPQNPIFVDPDKGRNGGLLRRGDELYRVSQKQGFNIYGKEFSINKIIQIDEVAYDEISVGEVSPTFFPNTFGTHHMHSNNRVTVYDYCQISRISD